MNNPYVHDCTSHKLHYLEYKCYDEDYGCIFVLNLKDTLSV